MNCRAVVSIAEPATCESILNAHASPHMRGVRCILSTDIRFASYPLNSRGRVCVARKTLNPKPFLNCAHVFFSSLNSVAYSIKRFRASWPAGMRRRTWHCGNLVRTPSRLWDYQRSSRTIGCGPRFPHRVEVFRKQQRLDDGGPNSP